MRNEKEKWHWQKAGTAWKGIGIYHVTMAIPSREPLLGKLVIPENDPTQARVERTELGNSLVLELLHLPTFYPEIQILQYCLMPDHLHAVIYVRQQIKKSIRIVARGFWQGAKKLGRTYTPLIYKPSDLLFDSVAAGRMLILSPHSYDAGKRRITRNECVQLNNMAEEIADE